MPNTMPTLCRDGVRCVSTMRRRSEGKLLVWRNLSQFVSLAMPASNLLILFVILVRDQEVGGSNPLAPTKIQGLYAINGGRPHL